MATALSGVSAALVIVAAMTMRLTMTTLVVVAVLGLIVVGCGAGGSSGAGSASGSGSGSTTTDPVAARAQWKPVEPGGDCLCADGSTFRFWVRRGDPRKVLFFYRAGGACWSAATCAKDGSDGTAKLYSASIDEHPSRWSGVLDLTDRRNPFADWTIVYVPYCTGDVFAGNATTTYAPGLTVHHKGYVDGRAAVDYAASKFPHASQVVVAGVSAGSLTAPLYGGLASDRFPDADITVLADSSGAWRSIDAIAKAWGTAHAIPDWPENAGLSIADWNSPQRLYIQVARHAPRITFARHDYAYDHVQVTYDALLGTPSADLLADIEANDAVIKAGGVDLHSFTGPGDDHGALQYDRFYTDEVGGQTLVDWVTRLVDHEPIADVRCTSCGKA
jgi:hypothetical protein